MTVVIKYHHHFCNQKGSRKLTRVKLAEIKVELLNIYLDIGTWTHQNNDKLDFHNSIWIKYKLEVFKCPKSLISN